MNNTEYKKKYYEENKDRLKKQIAENTEKRNQEKKLLNKKINEINSTNKLLEALNYDIRITEKTANILLHLIKKHEIFFYL